MGGYEGVSSWIMELPHGLNGPRPGQQYSDTPSWIAEGSRKLGLGFRV